MIRCRLRAVPVLALMVSACGEADPTGPQQWQIEITTSETTDTIGSVIDGISVSVRNSDRSPVPDVTINFSTINAAGFESHLGEQRFLYVSQTVAGSGLVPTTSFGTNSAGGGNVQVVFNDLAGPAMAIVRVPAAEFTDTVSFTITPGVATDIVGIPRDTTVTLGATIRVAPEAVDRAGNSVSTAPAQAVATPGVLSVEEDSVTALAVGAGQLSWTLAGASVDADVVVLPTGSFAAAYQMNQREIGLVLMNTDGSDVRVLRRWVGWWGGHIPFLPTPAWSPDELSLAYNDSSTLVVDDLAGQVDTLDTGLAGHSRISWTSDGNWIVYQRSDEIWRVSPDGAVRELLLSGGNGHGIDAQGRYLLLGGRHSSEVHDLTDGSVTSLSGSTNPGWSPTGSMIALTGDHLGIDVYSWDGTLSKIESYTQFETGGRAAWTWSPDERFILLHSSNGWSLVDRVEGDAFELAGEWDAPYTHPAWRSLPPG